MLASITLEIDEKSVITPSGRCDHGKRSIQSTFAMDHTYRINQILRYSGLLYYFLMVREGKLYRLHDPVKFRVRTRADKIG